MERYQAVQHRAAQTAALVGQHFPELRVGAVAAEQLQTLALTLGVRAQQRDDALVAYEEARGEEHQGFLAVRALTLALPKAVQGELDAALKAEAALLELLAPVFGVVPSHAELALRRAQKLVSVLKRIDDYLAAQDPPRDPIRSAGRGSGELAAAIERQIALRQAREDRATEVATARTALHDEAALLDRLNKRFYHKLKAETHGNAALIQALAQIDTGTPHRPATLSIREVGQGGSEGRQVLVSYVAATYDDGANNVVEWRTASDSGGAYPQSQPASRCGNALGPFAAGTRVELRTRVSRGGATTTGSVRTLTVS